MTLITCQQLSHRYGSKRALDNLDFTLQAGEPIGLVGPNGAGKTTLLSILSGFIKPTSGKALVMDRQPGSAGLIGKVSALPQDARLDPGFNIIEQLVLFGQLQGLTRLNSNREANRLLAKVNLAEVADKKPQTLSHGMAKRVAIAQTLIGSPSLVLLDEPTAGLDPVNVRNVRQLIAEHSDRTTFIISSHDLTELDRLCQHIILLDKGVMQYSTNRSVEQSLLKFITLTLENTTAVTEVIARLKVLNGVQDVSNPQKNEFLITYNPNVAAQMDLQLIQCLYDNHWPYRQLAHGKTLEEKLFFNH